MALSLIAATTALPAQAVTGALEGSFVSTTGQPVAGVNVVVRGPAMPGERGLSSDERGRFRALALPAGSYVVLGRRIGFAPVRIDSVTVRLGETTILPAVRLDARAVELGEVVISGARQTIDPTTAAAVTSLDSSQFRALPSGRDFRSLMAFAPMANASAYGDGVNVAGGTGLENAYFVDGIHTTDPMTANGGLVVPWNFIRQVQVTTGGYEAEFGRSQGAVVNVVTNSGGDDFSAQAVAFYSGNQLRSRPRWGLGQDRVERFSQHDVGVSAGGPLRRHQLWYFAAWNPFVESRDASYPGIDTQRDTKTRHLLAGKLTWRASPSTDLTVTLLGDPSERDRVGADNVLATVLDATVVRSRESGGSQAGSIQLRQRWGPRLLLAASLNRLSSRVITEPRNGLVVDRYALTRLDDYVENSTSGNFNWFARERAARTSGDMSLTWLAARHAVKAGVSMEDGRYRVRQGASFLWRYPDAAAGGGSYYGWYQRALSGRGGNRVSTAYVQDSWELTSRARLNFGLRWESQHIYGDTASEKDVRGQIAPRIGMVYQPGAMGTQKVFGSFGRFYEQVPLRALFFWNSVAIDTDSTYAQNPLVVHAAGRDGSSVVSAGKETDGRLRGQYYDEATLGYERRLGTRHRLAVRGVMRTLRSALEDSYVNGISYVGNPGRGRLAALPRAARAYRGLEATVERLDGGTLSYAVTYVLSRNHGNYTGLAATDDAESGNPGELSVPNSGGQFDIPEIMANATGLLPNDRTHVLKIRGRYEISSRIELGWFGIVASGVPLNEFGTYTWYSTFVRPRGTAGRTPTTWNSDIRVSWDLPWLGGRLSPRLLLDVFNVGNQRRPEILIQKHYVSGDGATNPNFGQVRQYQAPLSARVGVIVGF